MRIVNVCLRSELQYARANRDKVTIRTSGNIVVIFARHVIASFSGLVKCNAYHIMVIIWKQRDTLYIDPCFSKQSLQTAYNDNRDSLVQQEHGKLSWLAERDEISVNLLITRRILGPLVHSRQCHLKTICESDFETLKSRAAADLLFHKNFSADWTLRHDAYVQSVAKSFGSSYGNKILLRKAAFALRGSTRLCSAHWVCVWAITVDTVIFLRWLRLYSRRGEYNWSVKKGQSNLSWAADLFRPRN